MPMPVPMSYRIFKQMKIYRKHTNKSFDFDIHIYLYYKWFIIIGIRANTTLYIFMLCTTIFIHHIVITSHVFQIYAILSAALFSIFHHIAWYEFLFFFCHRHSATRMCLCIFFYRYHRNFDLVLKHHIRFKSYFSYFDETQLRKVFKVQISRQVHEHYCNVDVFLLRETYCF